MKGRSTRTLTALAMSAVAVLVSQSTTTSFAAVPVLSWRRLPVALDALAARARLDLSLDGAIAPPVQAGVSAAAAANSCLVVSTGSTVLYEHNPAELLIPASNMKLLSGLAVLDKLGASDTFVTQVKADAAPVSGAITGNLYLIGSGDPLLRTPAFVSSQPFSGSLYTHLQDLAAQVRAAGVTHISGSVVGDESHFDSERDVASWGTSYAAQGVVGPLSALEVDDGFVQGPKGFKAASNPPLQAASTFAALLVADGVSISGAPAAAPAPATAVPVTSISSAPLSQVLGQILRPSDDTGAELLVKELGSRFGGAGSTAAGIAVMRSDLESRGISLRGLVALDGSGLDRLDRLSCRLVDQVLVAAGANSVLAADLPVAAQSGTLEFRFAGTAVAGRMMAKTGTLDGVSALSGYMAALPLSASSAARTPLNFAFIVNGAETEQARIDMENNVALALAAFPSPVAPTSPSPSPSPVAPTSPAPGPSPSPIAPTTMAPTTPATVAPTSTTQAQ